MTFNLNNKPNGIAILLGLMLINLLLSVAPAWAADRVALVIGNSQYDEISSLKNPQADAKAIAERLKKLNFKIIRPIRKQSDVQSNLDLGEVIKARRAFRKAANGANIAFLYYAGHGASLGDNRQAHILPVDVNKPGQDSSSLELLEKQSISLDSLLAKLDDKAELTVAVFDACREIPELEKNRSIFNRVVGGNASWRGLQKIERGRKRIVAYAGDMGQLVADGGASYSPYTSRLIEVLDSNPWQEVGDLFRDVATKVESYTGQYPVVEIQSVPPNLFYLAKKENSHLGSVVNHPATQNEVQNIDTESNLTKPEPKPETYALVLNTTPKADKIRITNIQPVYHDGILLKPGKYRLEANKAGYKIKTEWVMLTDADINLQWELEKLPDFLQPKMHFIRGGSFQMGSPATEKKRESDERQHKVQINDFWMSETEVTFDQWQACVNDGGCQSNKKPDDEGWGRGKRPVINVSWHDANEYARWLSRKTGKPYRLPTEAEWEYAARTGSPSAYPWGDSISCSQADYNYTGCNSIGTSPVGSYQANAWSLHDTVGNVWEWTCSAYEENYNGSESQCAKLNDNRSRVLRGGSWFSEPRFVRSALRNRLTASKRYFYVGFRLSRTR